MSEASSSQEALAAALWYSGSSPLCSAPAVATLLLGIAVLLVISTLYSLVIIQKRRIAACLMRETLQENDGPASPPLTVIMPVKGVHACSDTNWRALVSSVYSGPVEYIFVVESTEDDAYGPLTKLAAEPPVEAHIKVLVAGFSTSCTQKIFNLVHGIRHRAANTELVLFVDDDVHYPKTVAQRMSREFAVRPNVFAVSGLPFEEPNEDASLACYLKMIYYYWSYAILFREEVTTLWGGCLMLRASSLDDLTRRWLDGGYSDDMITAGYALEKGPGALVMPHWLVLPARGSSSWTLGNYLSFARRQVFAALTSATPSDRANNRRLLAAGLVCSLPMWAVALAWFIELPLLLLDAALLEMYAPERARALELGGAECSFKAYLVIIGVPTAVAALAVTSALLRRALARVAAALERDGNPPVVRGNKDFNFALFSIAYGIAALLWPIISIFVFLSPRRITWSGTEYVIRNGRVQSVRRPNPTAAKRSRKAHTEDQANATPV